MRDLAKALQSLRPGAQWTLNGNTYEGLNWLPVNTTTKPSQAELEVEADRLHQEFLDNQYQRDRAKEYPSVQDQLDMMYWDLKNGTKNWENAVKAVKDKHPKPAK